MLIGLGFFTVSLVWSIYNVAVPLYLKDFALSGAMVGFIMSLDNIFAVVFQPVFGALSDKTNTRYGRRMPYLLVGIPMSAIFFILSFFKDESSTSYDNSYISQLLHECVQSSYSSFDA